MKKISIPFSELHFDTARSSGLGGQNVNKIETKVRLTWNVLESTGLTESEINAVRKHSSYRNKISDDGDVQLVCQEFRTQKLNKETVLATLYKLLTVALTPKKRRVPTKVSKSVVKRRVAGKRIRSEVKGAKMRVGGESID